jgi:hypothetical protein
MLFQHWSRRITAATLDRGAFCSAGPDFFSTTSPQPMMPQTTTFGASAALCISARGSRGTSARQPATKARWVRRGFERNDAVLTINYSDLVINGDLYTLRAAYFEGSRAEPS